ncbi:hypothetical protein Vretifemale_13015 [Volvox reticuliferus]|uniref:Uncharacterized protein n=2 Tax=Volvox reticuliferus TaxID=1737510 RepID=A0A8J4CSP4_9CHLO|nr:hypothetical protein Vretifemale_13015 [Volvox reticuliferus]
MWRGVVASGGKDSPPVYVLCSSHLIRISCHNPRCKPITPHPTQNTHEISPQQIPPNPPHSNPAKPAGACLPNCMTRNSTSSLPRPPEISGKQYNSRLPQSPNCTNSTPTPAMISCWAAIGLYWDLATYGFSLDETLNPGRAGYNL